MQMGTMQILVYTNTCAINNGTGCEQRNRMTDSNRGFGNKKNILKDAVLNLG